MKRIFRPWHEWECFKAGMHAIAPPRPLTADQALEQYAAFLRNTPRFSAALERVTTEWPRSCENFLSNENLNRIAWLGQASACIHLGIPRRFRGGFKLLTEAERATANATALEWLNRWLTAHGEATIGATRDFLLTGEPDELDAEGPSGATNAHERIERYVRVWERRCYGDGIPDEVPAELVRLAPSYRAICIALLKNDHAMQSLGYTPRPSRWYMALKRIEIRARLGVHRIASNQYEFDFALRG